MAVVSLCLYCDASTGMQTLCYTWVKMWPHMALIPHQMLTHSFKVIMHIFWRALARGRRWCQKYVATFLNSGVICKNFLPKLFFTLCWHLASKPLMLDQLWKHGSKTAAQELSSFLRPHYTYTYFVSEKMTHFQRILLNLQNSCPNYKWYFPKFYFWWPLLTSVLALTS